MAVDLVEIARLEVELAEVRAAISDVLLHGAGHGANGRSLQRADLATLYEREKVLIGRLGTARRGGGIPVWQAVPRG